MLSAEQLARPAVRRVIAEHASMAGHSDAHRRHLVALVGAEEAKRAIEATGGHWIEPMYAVPDSRPIMPAPPTGPCRHLGAEVVGYRECATCKGRVRLKEFACAVGLGVEGRAVPNRDCGPGLCSGYQPIPPPTTDFVRHLLYHVYPVRGNGAWQRNVGRLVERLRIFNGRIVVAIVTDPPSGRRSDPTGPHPPDRARHIAPCDSPEAVMEAFGPWRDKIEWLVTENDPHLREVKTLVPMLEKFLPAGPQDIALYAQAKGTTRHRSHIAHHWSDVQYIVYLDYVRLVEEQLRTAPVTGAFKKLGPGWNPSQSISDWHYSGSWFWLRLAELFKTNWRMVDQHWSGVEPYPSQKFRCADAACLFMEAQVPHMHLYHRGFWRDKVDPDFEDWRRANERWFNPVHNI